MWHTLSIGKACARLLRAYCWMRLGPHGPSVRMRMPGVAPSSHLECTGVMHHN